MNTQPTITEIVPHAQRAIQHLIQLVRSMSPAQIEEPLLAEDRSVKDVLGHLTWWDQWLLVTLPPAPGEPAPAIMLPLAEQIPPTNDWADELNDKVLVYNRSRAFLAIWQELTATCDRLLQRVAQLSDADLYDPAGMAAVIGQPVAPLICGIYEHYEEHAHEFEGAFGVIIFYGANKPNGFLSNFFAAPVEIDGATWPTTEHYYQAQKFADPALQAKIRNAPAPGAAKNFAWAPDVQVRADWDAVRNDVMLVALRAKFTQHPDLRAQLLATGAARLVEHTTNDRYWGDGGDGSGQNQLGRLLMLVRSELKEQTGR